MNFKKRIAVFLCLLLTLPAILGALPQAQLEVWAASTVSLYWSNVYTSTGASGPEFQVTKKTKNFYVGDFVSAYVSGGSSYGYLSVNSGVKYTSSKPSVAAINSSTGLVTPKKTGSTKITVAFKSAKVTCTVKVVSSVGKGPSSYSKLEKASNAFVKAYGKKVTASNRYKVVNARNIYLEEYNDAPYENNVSKYNGVNMITSTSNNKYVYTNKVCMPILAHAYALSSAVDQYVKTVNPIGTKPAKLFNVTSVSGKGTKVTAKLSGKVTEDQVFGIKAAVSKVGDTQIVKSNEAVFPVWVKDTNTGHKYCGVATATKGSKNVVIELKIKLTKGHTYKLVGYNGYYGYLATYWTNQGKTSFKAN